MTTAIMRRAGTIAEKWRCGKKTYFAKNRLPFGHTAGPCDRHDFEQQCVTREIVNVGKG